jgi:uncharacterized protein (DUF302 family)
VTRRTLLCNAHDGPYREGMQPQGADSAEVGTGPHDALGVVTVACPAPVDETVQRVVALLEGLGIELFAVIDHSGEAREVGLSMPETKLLVFGNPKGGTPLMLAHPLVALDLPLKLLIWENGAGEVFASYNAPSYLADRYGLTPSETAAISVVETISQSIVA